MTARSPSAFLLSAAFHALVIGLLLLLGYAASQRVEDSPRILELVTGEGDNFAAKVAPALGTPGGEIKFDIPVPPEPKAEPRPEPKAELAPPPPREEAPTIPNYSKQIQRQIVRAESKAKKEIAKQRAAEAKRLAEEKKRLAEEAKRLTKAEFDAKYKKTASSNKTTPKAPPPKIAKIDADGIATGVTGGSTANRVGGAGGRALTSDNDDVMAAYFAMLQQKMTRLFVLPPGVADDLIAGVSVRSNADGSLAGGRISTSSGSKDFDEAVLDALRRVSMPPRPDGKSEQVTFRFTLTLEDQG